MAPGFNPHPGASARTDMKQLFSQDFAKILRASKLRIGSVRAQGVPAILLGSAAIVLAAGSMRALIQGAPALPESLRELRQLLDSTRSAPKKLN